MSLVTSFVRHWNASGRTPSTGAIYAGAVKRLAEHHDLRTVTADDLAEYVARRLTERSAATAVMDVRAFRSFFAWMADEDERPDNPAKRLRHPRVPETAVPVATEDHLRRLLGVCGKRTAVGRRDAAMISLMARSGLRRGELAVLDVAHLDLDARTLVVPRTKGQRPRTVPIHVETAARLDAYLRARSAEQGPLFVTSRGTRFTPDGIGSMFERRCTQAGIDRIGCHALRRSFASWWLGQGGTEVGLMAVAGWTSNQMIARYTRMDAERLAMDEFRRLAG